MALAGASGSNSYVLLQVGNRRFAMPSRNVVELAPPVRLHEFPHTSKLIAGVIVRRGRIVPVYDVAPLLTGRPSSLHRFYLISWLKMGAEQEASAVPVSGECELASGDVSPRTDQDPSYVAGNLEFESESIPVLDFESMVAAGSAAAAAVAKAQEVRP